MKRSSDRDASESVHGCEPSVLLDRLARLGSAGVELLRIVPHLHIAWLTTERLEPEDRRHVLDLARARGVASGSDAHRLLDAWLTERPSEEFFAAALSRLKSMLLDLPPEAQAAIKTDIIAYLHFLDRLALDPRSRREIVGVSSRGTASRRPQAHASTRIDVRAARQHV